MIVHGIPGNITLHEVTSSRWTAGDHRGLPRDAAYTAGSATSATKEATHRSDRALAVGGIDQLTKATGSTKSGGPCRRWPRPPATPSFASTSDTPSDRDARESAGAELLAGHARATLKEGMVFAIEPMVNVGGYETYVLDDGWGVMTQDGKLSAHFEHTIAVTDDGPEVFTA